MEAETAVITRFANRIYLKKLKETLREQHTEHLLRVKYRNESYTTD